MNNHLYKPSSLGGGTYCGANPEECAVAGDGTCEDCVKADLTLAEELVAEADGKRKIVVGRAKKKGGKK